MFHPLICTSSVFCFFYVVHLRKPLWISHGCSRSDSARREYTNKESNLWNQLQINMLLLQYCICIHFFSPTTQSLVYLLALSRYLYLNKNRTQSVETKYKVLIGRCKLSIRPYTIVMFPLTDVVIWTFWWFVCHIFFSVRKSKAFIKRCMYSIFIKLFFIFLIF